MNKKIQIYIAHWVGRRLNMLFTYAPERAINKALKLFVTPRKGKLSEWHKQFLKTAKRTELALDGYKLQTYYWAGKGACVLLVHGWESNAARWRSLIPQLQAEGFAVLAIDAPAHGGSEGKRFTVPLYGKAIAQLADKYTPKYAVGHSLGGMTLLFQQAQTPLKGVEKMVLLAPALEMQNIAHTFQYKLALKPKVMEALNQRFIKEFGYSFKSFSMLKFAEDFQFPALFIHDRKDKIISCEESRKMVGLWSKSRLFITENLGHRLRDDLVDYETVQFLKK